MECHCLTILTVELQQSPQPGWWFFRKKDMSRIFNTFRTLSIRAAVGWSLYTSRGKSAPLLSLLRDAVRMVMLYVWTKMSQLGLGSMRYFWMDGRAASRNILGTPKKRSAHDGVTLVLELTAPDPQLWHLLLLLALYVRVGTKGILVASGVVLELKTHSWVNNVMPMKSPMLNSKTNLQSSNWPMPR